MQKRSPYFLLLSALLCLSGCGSTTDNSTTSDLPTSSSSSSLTQKDYYLTGDVDLKDNASISFHKEGDIYTYSNLILRRDNSFKIYSNLGDVPADHFASLEGFKEGNNHYIRVLNEGIYNIQIDTTNQEEKVTLTKLSTSYSTVELEKSTGEKVPFTLNDDFTYTLNNVDLMYREKFAIRLDNELLSFNDFAYNDLYYDALRFGEENIQVIQKGTFNFSLNFLHAKALTVTSDNLALPQLLPSDADSYDALIESLAPQFKQSGTKFHAVETITTQGEDNASTTTHNYYDEYINLNERYYEEVRGDDENPVTLKATAMLTDKNYYEIVLHENTTTSPTFNGYLLGEAPEKEDQGNSTLVKLDKNYITKEKAIEKMLGTGVVGKETSITSYLKNTTKVNHLASNQHNGTYDKQYHENMKLTATYAGEVGDGMTITSSNTEKYVNGASSKFFLNEIQFTTDNQGRIVNGSISISSYEGAILDENNELLSTVTPTTVTTYEFNYEYNERVTVSSYHIDPATYIMKNVYMGGEITVLAGGTINNASFPIVEIEPSTSIDKDKLQVIEFDSTYLTQGKGDKTTFTANKKGETSIVIGTLYSDFSVRLNVVIEYAKPSNISISPSISYNSEFYVGTSYTYTATVSTSYADPAVTVTSSNEAYVKVESIDTISDQRANGKAKFTLKMLAATDSPVTITVASKDTPTVSYSFKISKVLPSLTLEDVAGTYYYSYNTAGGDYELSILEDGNATLKHNNELAYSFKVKMEGASAVLDSSDEVGSFTATRSVYNSDENIRVLQITAFTDKDGTDIKKQIYTYGDPKFYEAWSKFIQYSNMKDEANNATFILESLKPGSSSAPVATFKVVSGSDVYTFTWSASSYGNKGTTSSLTLNGSSVYGTITITYVSETSITLRLYKYSSFDITFNFVAVTE